MRREYSARRPDAIEHPVFAVLVDQAVERLQERHAHHELGGILRPSTLALIGAGTCRVDFIEDGVEGHQFVDRFQVGDEIRADYRPASDLRVGKAPRTGRIHCCEVF